MYLFWITLLIINIQVLLSVPNRDQLRLNCGVIVVFNFFFLFEIRSCNVAQAASSPRVLYITVLSSPWLLKDKSCVCSYRESCSPPSVSGEIHSLNVCFIHPAPVHSSEKPKITASKKCQQQHNSIRAEWAVPVGPQWGHCRSSVGPQ